METLDLKSVKAEQLGRCNEEISAQQIYDAFCQTYLDPEDRYIRRNHRGRCRVADTVIVLPPPVWPGAHGPVGLWVAMHPALFYWSMLTIAHKQFDFSFMFLNSGKFQIDELSDSVISHFFPRRWWQVQILKCGRGGVEGANGHDQKETDAIFF